MGMMCLMCWIIEDKRELLRLKNDASVIFGSTVSGPKPLRSNRIGFCQHSALPDLRYYYLCISRRILPALDFHLSHSASRFGIADQVLMHVSVGLSCKPLCEDFAP